MKELGQKVLAGDVRSASRLIRNLEDQIPGSHIAMQQIFTKTGNSHVIGITGAPGAGKSTLTDELVFSYRKKNKTVGVLAVDPTSPFTGGALLGDRIRMLRHAEDKGVFLRSLATRGSMGGISKAVGEAIHVMDAMGKDSIIVETVGVGQQEVEIINHAHTVIVVLVPGMGDEIQALKAGLMEIADIFVINKADRDGAGKLYKEVSNMVHMSNDAKGWEIPVLLVESVLEPKKFAESVVVLCDKIEEHYRYLVDNDLLSERMRRKTNAEINEALWGAILQPVLNDLGADGEIEKMVDKLLKKETDPYSLAAEVAARYKK
ncbi:LAO/AO transport system ATPase [Desulfofarcimen acetoxidans DSM 771]|jgi:LAO/AO transport system kinase|uniref:LAO/AO transport system ATPase n=1 Tax=Desulfofarcimen acetoxidans (strain ATCC 49208 / DSM 771 / KCTC 5769 / VKM B-1644 / 5575) TaxID=485916 RepID=C8VXU6_DESAS|nr:methylmalonyl Co-A mutase-associated GTPase MeaB [Desulfofarcimen acetoxidans]ACV62752.1 LAO/AO transport system ATPase [Desulfofarcimen acetoxidans DSM 771]